MHGIILFISDVDLNFPCPNMHCSQKVRIVLVKIISWCKTLQWSRPISTRVQKKLSAKFVRGFWVRSFCKLLSYPWLWLIWNARVNLLYKNSVVMRISKDWNVITVFFYLKRICIECLIIIAVGEKIWKWSNMCFSCFHAVSKHIEVNNDCRCLHWS